MNADTKCETFSGDLILKQLLFGYDDNMKNAAAY